MKRPKSKFMDHFEPSFQHPVDTPEKVANDLNVALARMVGTYSWGGDALGDITAVHDYRLAAIAARDGANTDQGVLFEGAA